MNTDDFYRYSFDLESLETEELGVGPFPFPSLKRKLPPTIRFLRTQRTGIFENGKLTPMNLPRQISSIPVEGIMGIQFN